MSSRKTIYFIAVAVLGGVLLAVGQIWAIGLVGSGCAGAATFGVIKVLDRDKSK
jgi:hypothetical protein